MKLTVKLRSTELPSFQIEEKKAFIVVMASSMAALVSTGTLLFFFRPSPCPLAPCFAASVADCSEGAGIDGGGTSPVSRGTMGDNVASGKDPPASTSLVALAASGPEAPTSASPAAG